MFRLILPLLAAAFLSAPAAAQFPPDGPKPPPPPGTETPPPAYDVSVIEPDFCGGGVVIRSGNGKSLILTARHNVEGGKGVKVAAGTKEYRGRVTVAPRGDLALVEIDVELQAAPLAAASPVAGTPVHLWSQGRKREGVFSGPRGKADSYGGATVGATIKSEPGDSGRAVLNAAGQVVGVGVSGSATEPCIAVSVEEISAFVAAKK